MALSLIWVSSLHLVPSPLKHLYWKVLTTGRCSLQFDVNDEGVSVKERPFPSEIAVVSGPGSGPDGVIWSVQTKTVIWIELTSPWDENFTKTHFKKMDR